MKESGGGRQAVGDGVGAGAASLVSPSAGNIGSGLELLSDPKGVDFRPYLTQILNSVRRNWYAVIPESARLGLERGRTAIQFIIVRNGDVPKLVIASSSQSHPLDRAAVAGISASLPFPPLPSEFSGSEVRLQFVFLYNQRR
jgi:TonB family protein